MDSFREKMREIERRDMERKRWREIYYDDTLIVKITMQQQLRSIGSILPFSTERQGEKVIAQESRATQRQKAEERMCHGCLYGNKLTLEKMRQNPINTAAGKRRKPLWDSQ